MVVEWMGKLFNVSTLSKIFQLATSTHCYTIASCSVGLLAGHVDTLAAALAVGCSVRRHAFCAKIKSIVINNIK